MSTRSRIGITNPDGSIISIYCHDNGYPSYVGLMLDEYYKTPERIRDLIALGDLGDLDKEINPDSGKTHTPENRQPGVTLAAIRDGHAPEEENRPKTYTDRADYIKNGTEQSEEYLYVFDAGDWFCYDVKTPENGWMPIDYAVKVER
ncbi:MAG: hypothetical protein IJT68_09660 [Lentisphaeria bacterium]|nr:hypothetical protein [Lentisphaeria bacterium]